MESNTDDEIQELQRKADALRWEMKQLEEKYIRQEIDPKSYSVEMGRFNNTLQLHLENIHELKQALSGENLPPLPTIQHDSISRSREPMEMKLIDTLQVPGTEPKSIQLLLGDLTNIPPEHAVDILVVSAFMDDYYPTPGTLIHALYQKGVNIRELSADKIYDYTKELSCWLSQKITGKQEGIAFDHVLLFEGFVSGLPSEMVGDVFRALFPFLTGETNKVATSLLSTGGAGMDQEIMMEQLVEGAYYWMRNGLPLHEFKIVIYSESTLELILPVFNSLKSKLEEAELTVKEESETKDHDIFISYSHKNSKEAEAVFNRLKELKQDISVFIDKMELKPGNSWQQEIFNALERSKLILTLLSPYYLESKVCIEEYDIAMMRNREAEQQVLFPLLVTDTDLPYYMRMIQYLDLQDLSTEKLRTLLQQIITKVDSSVPVKTSLPDEAFDPEIVTFSTPQEEDLQRTIQDLQNVYKNRIPIERIVERLNSTFSVVVKMVEDLIIEGKLNATIDSIGTSESQDDFLELN